MPLPKGTRFRVTRRGGVKIRLAFRKGTNEVIEAKSLTSGATHTPAEFAADKKRRRLRMRADD